MGVLNGPPPPDTNYAVNYLSVVGVFSIFATSLCAARIWTRIQPKVVLRIDDYMILFATVLIPHLYRLVTLKANMALADTVLSCICCRNY